jgi:hypothetical protein
MAKNRVVQTHLWNPMIFAIFYGELKIVQYIIDEAAQDNGL